MEQEDREKLMQLLTDLINAHANVLVCESVEQIVELIARRNGIKNDILNYVDELIGEPLTHEVDGYVPPID